MSDVDSDVQLSIELLAACSCVEIGSGSGYVTCSLALLLKHHNKSAACIATDISAYATKATQASLAAHQVIPA